MLRGGPGVPQADVISRVDAELRSEMVEAQALVAKWVTEQKHCADTVALAGQRQLETDKGAQSDAYYCFRPHRPPLLASQPRPHTHPSAAARVPGRREHGAAS